MCKLAGNGGCQYIPPQCIEPMHCPCFVLRWDIATGALPSPHVPSLQGSGVYSIPVPGPLETSSRHRWSSLVARHIKLEECTGEGMKENQQHNTKIPPNLSDKWNNYQQISVGPNSTPHVLTVTWASPLIYDHCSYATSFIVPTRQSGTIYSISSYSIEQDSTRNLGSLGEVSRKLCQQQSKGAAYTPQSNGHNSQSVSVVCRVKANSWTLLLI